MFWVHLEFEKVIEYGLQIRASQPYVDEERIE